LPHTVFGNLNQRLFRSLSDKWGRWRGLRVITADASDVSLITRDAIRRVIQYAKVFALHLPGVEMTLRTALYGAAPASGKCSSNVSPG
jgi:hypothetical protein